MPRLGRTFGVLAVSNLVVPLFSIVLVLAVSRVLGVEALGKYSTMMAVFVVCQGMAGFGLPVIITREVARRPARAWIYFVETTLVAVALAGASLLLVVPATLLLAGDAELRLGLTLVLLGALPSGLAQCAEAVLLARDRAVELVIVGVGEAVARAVVGTALVVSGHGVVALGALILLLRLAAATAFLVMLRRAGVPLRMPRHTTLARRMLREVPVVGAIPVVNALYSRADTFLLASLASWEAVGIYSAGLRLIDVARTIPPAYARALYPQLARLRDAAPERFTRESEDAVRRAVLIALPLSAALAGLAEPMLTTLFGAEWASGAVVLRVLALSLPAMAVSVTLAQMLFAAGRQVVDLRVNVVSTAVIIAVGLLLIPRAGALGGAIAVVVAATTYAGLQYAGVRRHVAPIRAGGTMTRAAVVLAGTVLVTGMMAAAHPVWAAVSGGLLVVGGCLAAGLIVPGELRGVVGQLRQLASS